MLLRFENTTHRSTNNFTSDLNSFSLGTLWLFAMFVTYIGDTVKRYYDLYTKVHLHKALPNCQQSDRSLWQLLKKQTCRQNTTPCLNEQVQWIRNIFPCANALQYRCRSCWAAFDKIIVSLFNKHSDVSLAHVFVMAVLDFYFVFECRNVLGCDTYWLYFQWKGRLFTYLMR